MNNTTRAFSFNALPLFSHLDSTLSCHFFRLGIYPKEGLSPGFGADMPTYQYACTACSHEFEAIQSFSDNSLTSCPECSGEIRKIYSAVGVVFKGSGFYKTDSVAKKTTGESTTPAPTTPAPTTPAPTAPAASTSKVD